jgi:hypothetical protein
MIAKCSGLLCKGAKKRQKRRAPWKSNASIVTQTKQNKGKIKKIAPKP